MRLNFSLVCMVYALASVATFIAYAMDKSAAKQNGWRISERTLQLMVLFCGWPGGWLAQKWLRHKTKKRSFQWAFWLMVVVNCTALVAIVVIAAL